ncbi:NADPH:quinone reductase-like Zn-dependent oxidoreductase [Lutibacter oceani]|uniref:NADPH:quinone reductase-like Zn-dependent oxidoreductase n=1 Tax=Lutibacter oceani TaxID=1853311 RepID=A0A3D9RIC2_9FLAO|nr:NAD(P)-dependent alcohol dehydrogenase [Lutibacter oceani]REE78848.1 NADPH:quinone reductase-like Zn-dependent oxidoreductase [Lutibacter oceani]
MKKAVYTSYGSPEVIQIIDIEKPIPNPHEVLVKIKASSITRADTMMRQGTPKFGRLIIGLFKPKNTALGTGFSGVVESLGNKVTKFKIDDEVFGEKLFSNGTNAEYLCISEDSIITLKPHNISHKQAAPICDGFLTSYSFLRDIGKLKQGQHILVNGASGSLGTAAVQLAKNMGATVTGVCSTKNVDLVKSIGADYVIDYTKNDFTKMRDYFDIVYDSVGKTNYSKSKKTLKANGIFMTPVLGSNVLWYSIISPKRVKFSATGIRKQRDLKMLLAELVTFFSQGKLNTVIDKTYKLENIIEAHKYLESDHKVGNLAIVN